MNSFFVDNENFDQSAHLRLAHLSEDMFFHIAFQITRSERTNNEKWNTETEVI